jgi:superfamily II DNA helicase RecQ
LGEENDLSGAPFAQTKEWHLSHDYAAFLDQARQINAIQGCRAYVLNGQTNTKTLRDQVKDCASTHILTSPEIALGTHLLEILRHKAFWGRLVLGAIDELHIVEQWGESLCKQYSQLKIL